MALLAFTRTTPTYRGSGNRLNRNWTWARSAESGWEDKVSTYLVEREIQLSTIKANLTRRLTGLRQEISHGVCFGNNPQADFSKASE